MRVLVIEDELQMASLIRHGLLKEGFAVDIAASGEDSLWMVAAVAYDAIVLDVMLPGSDGFETCRLIRDKGVRAPVLMLTARDSVEDRVAGLDSGADDYLVKPFAFAELLARLQALIRRSTGQAEPTKLSIADLTLDLLGRGAERAGRAIELRPREFSLLEYLLRNQGRVLTKTMILSHVWGYNFDPGTNVVDVLISRLREKVDRDFEPKLIQTVRGVGYVMKVA